MDGFGQALRARRQAEGMRQADLVEALDRVIARSTLANVEVGRERPSARLWQAIQTHRPEWVTSLEPWYNAAHRPAEGPHYELSGPFEILSATYAYTFRDHRCPEEIIQVRQVRSLADGSNGYGLQIESDAELELDTEPLYGGWISRQPQPRPDRTGQQQVTRFHFDRVLRRGEVHEFATRSWVTQDEPPSCIGIQVVRPTAQITLALNFLGPRPSLVWRYDSPDPSASPPSEPSGPSEVIKPTVNGSYTLRVQSPRLGHDHGMVWRW